MTSPPVQPHPGLQQLDTLLPGYVSRPMPSPVKKRPRTGSRDEQIAHQRPEAERAPVETPQLRTTTPRSDVPAFAPTSGLFHSLQQELQQARVEAGSGPPPNTEAKGLSADFKLPELPGPKSIAQLPISPTLERLEACFDRLNAVHEFLFRTHIQATWPNIVNALKGTGAQGALSPDDVLALSQLCPDVVRVMHRSRPGGEAYQPHPWQRANLGPPTDEQRVALEGAAASEADAEQGDGAIPHPGHIATDGSGTVVRGALDDEAGVLMVVDPWHSLDEPPDEFISAVHQRWNRGNASDGREICADAEKEATEGGDAGARPDGEGVVERDGKRVRRRQKPRCNKRVRQAWALRRAAVLALALLQEQHFDGDPPPLPDAQPAAVETKQRAAPRRRSRQGKQAAQAAQPTAAEEVENTPAPLSLHALMCSGKWHPAFPVADVTLESIVAAAATINAAAAMERGAAAEAADALIAARVRAKDEGEDQAAKKGRGRAPAAPPQMLKRYPPCMDTTQVRRDGNVLRK